jgi:hypothetical protein
MDRAGPASPRELRASRPIPDAIVRSLALLERCSERKGSDLRVVAGLVGRARAGESFCFKGSRHLINNRQGGRRRGRGGQRQNLGGQPGGNRQDNRQRGNAAQLLEKYKNMARDAQLGGDRVQMEYYLQYAEHYFRVLNENRSRFDEQRRQRGEDGDDSDDEDDGYDTSGQQDDEDQREDERPQRRQRQERGERTERTERPERSRRPTEGRGRGDRQDRNGAEQANGSDERIAVEVLPPAIGRDDNEQLGSDEDESPKPRRRVRRPRAQDGESEIAPAA